MKFPNGKYSRDWNDPRYKEFRRAVLKRDRYKCQFPQCGSRLKLQVHHIIKWASNFLLRFKVGNGITLCRKHHDKIKGKEGCYVELFLTIINNKSL